MAGITWIHLSDWHQKGNDFDRKIIRDGLIKDIHNRTSISSDLAQIDFIIFSGDIAFSGQAEEYKSARTFLLDPLLKEVQLSRDKVFTVPGNHDIDQKLFRFLPTELTKPLDSDTKVQEWLTDENRKHLLEPFAAYENFIRRYTGLKQPAYACTRILTINGKQIGLLGLNSALMCGRHKITKEGRETDEDYGRLIVGEPQLYDGLGQIEKVDIRIAVIHHPFNWLFEFDANHVEERLKDQCHFILYGHQHKASVKVEGGTVGESVVIPAGASYGSRFVSDPRYINAYNFVHFDFVSCRGIAYLRRWSDQLNRFREDIDSFHPGQFPFHLSTLSDASPLENARRVTSATQMIETNSGNYPEQSLTAESLQAPHQQSASNIASGADTPGSSIDSSSNTMVIAKELALSFEQFFILAHDYIVVAANAVQRGYIPFKKKGRIKPIKCTEAISALNETLGHLEILDHLLINTLPFPPTIIKNHQRYIRNTHLISKQVQDLIDAIKLFRSSKYRISSEQIPPLHADIKDKFEQLLIALNQLDGFIKA